jgi:hypothetical protein
VPSIFWLPRVLATVIVLPDFEGPNSFVKSISIISLSSLTSHFTFCTSSPLCCIYAMFLLKEIKHLVALLQIMNPLKQYFGCFCWKFSQPSSALRAGISLTSKTGQESINK